MTIYGKVNCLVNSSSADGSYFIKGSDSYVGIWNLMTRAADDNAVSRIAYWTGSTNAAGSGSDYWNTADSVGRYAWSVWRFNTHAQRPWDFYILFQWDEQASQALTAPVSHSLTGSGVGTFAGVVFMQLAISYNPTTLSSSNPWNGTTNNDGTDTKGTGSTPHWVTGSAGDRLVVFPERNQRDFTNSDGFRRMDYAANFITNDFTLAAASEMNLWLVTGTKSDGIFCVGKRAPAGASWDILNMAGAYRARNEITSSCPGVFFSGDSTTNSYFGSSGIATTIPSIPSRSMGVLVPDGPVDALSYSDIESWAKWGIGQTNTILGQSNVSDLVPVSLIARSQTSRQQGFVGFMNPDVMVVATGIPNDTMNADETKVSIQPNGWSDGTPAAVRLVLPWSSSVGSTINTGVRREGNDF